jgi:hypothetical protein
LATQDQSITMTKFITYTFLFFISCSQTVNAEIYSWIDDNGTRIYTDQNPDGTQDKQIELDKNSVNYVPAPSTPKPAILPKVTTPNIMAAESKADAMADSDTMTEDQCQKTYRLSCDDVLNWQQHAMEQCQNDSRCSDPAFLERKYKPVPIADQLALAQRNAARRNRQQEKIELFIRQRYSDYCAVRQQQVCDTKNSDKEEQCKRQVEQFCSQDGDLDDILAKYDDLTPVQKQRYYQQAKQLQSQQRWQDLEHLLENLFDSLLLGSVSGGLL